MATVYGGGLFGAGLYGGADRIGVPFLPDLLGEDGRLAVEIAWGADLTVEAALWEWTDITTDVRQAPGISTSLGRGDEASTSQPATCTMVLDNSAARYSLGPASTNYPHVRRNTPVRVQVDPGDGTFRTVFFGGVVGFTPTWTLDGSDLTVKMEAAGTLRRLLQGDTPVISPLRRALLNRTDVVGYWPCEDGERATQLATALPLGNAMTFSGVPDLASSSTFVASQDLPVLKGSTFTGTITPYTSTGTIQVRALIEWPGTGETAGASVFRIYTSGSAARWDVVFRANGSLSVDAYDRFGNLINASGNVAFNVDKAPLARRWSFEAVQNGANIDYRVSTLSVADGSNGYFTFPQLAGRTVGAALIVQVNADQLLNNVVVGHVSVQKAQTSIFDDRFELSGYDGEVSFVRYIRLCGENDIPQLVTGDGTSFNQPSDRMGPQALDTVLPLLRAVERVDQGVLFDGVSAGLRFTSRRDIENNNPTLTIAASSLQLAGPFGPTDDDQRTRNRVEAKRKGGSSFLVEDRTGPMGVDVIGLYDDSIEVNVQDDSALPLYAGWLLSKGTTEGYRYPTLTVDLLATPELAVQWLNLIPGARIDVTGLDAVLPGHPAGVLSLVVEGLANDLTGDTWTGTARCSPFATWRTATVSAPTGDVTEYVGRADTDGGELAAAVAAGGTSISVTTFSGPLWTTTADDFPYDLDIGGRQVTVTACSDATSPQVMTIAPATHALPPFASVKLWRPAGAGL